MTRRNTSERDLEAQLRTARPEPTSEVTRAISDRVRPRRGFMGAMARVPLGPVAGLTAIVVAVVLALGGAGAALNAAGDATNVRKAKSAQTREAPSVNQYAGEDVVICVYGYAEHTVSQQIADELVAQGVAEYGPCPPSIFNP